MPLKTPLQSAQPKNGSAATSGKRAPDASTTQTPTTLPRDFPVNSTSAAMMKATPTKCARNHTSPSSAHHHTSVPARKKSVSSALVVTLRTPSRSASSHASPVATAPKRTATVV